MLACLSDADMALIPQIVSFYHGFSVMGGVLVSVFVFLSGNVRLF